MSLKELRIVHKQIEPILVAYTNFRGEIKDIPSRIKIFQENFTIFPPDQL